MPSKPTIKLDKLIELRDTVAEYSENFNYGYTLAKVVESHSNPNWNVINPEVCHTDSEVFNALTTHRKPTECGSVACLVGFTLALNPHNTFKWMDNFNKAEQLLGLRVPEADFLFLPGYYKDECDKYEFGNCPYLLDFDYSIDFPGFRACTEVQGHFEALRRLNYVIDHHKSLQD